MLNAVKIPPGADDLSIRKRLLNEYGIEIGGGLGAFKGKAWRIGLMGHGATKRNVDSLLTALSESLKANTNTIRKWDSPHATRARSCAHALRAGRCAQTRRGGARKNRPSSLCVGTPSNSHKMKRVQIQRPSRNAAHQKRDALGGR